MEGFKFVYDYARKPLEPTDGKTSTFNRNLRSKTFLI